ncbi:MAG TPA: ABC-F family ATP-binding cassette domain-containing protein [Candidatus Aveggerthella excrementigallinarum]|nr:ABC-F family ATP-binding cassette domain-containing protein [Candidatus Aveggerthella excrementigallinarum]
MALLLGSEKVTVDFPAKTVLDEVTAGIMEGDRIGIVGRNGDGKSTLLTVLAGTYEPDGGRVVRRSGVSVGLLGQTDALDSAQTVAHEVVGDRPEYEWASDAGVRDIISGLLADVPWNGLVGNLSGGQRRRVDLARLLVADWDILMLDEPTNHLDVRAIAWLADHLKRRWRAGEGALLVVTHDRWFLDEVCLSMWEVHDGMVEPFEGGYSAYIQQRVERDRQAYVAERKRQNILRKELAWLARGPQARGTKPKFRIDAARELIAAEPPVRDTLQLKQMAMQRLGKRVIDMERVTKRLGERTMLDDVTWLIGPGDRYGILGENGAGKTTLLRILRGELAPDAGRVKIGQTVKFAMLSQHLQELNQYAEDRVREVLGRYKTRYVVDGRELSPGQMIERLGFKKEHLNARVKDLSGGQKRRLQFMLILLDEPNVLILDEPGNDLDTDMLAVMEDLLDAWPGTLLLVTHDRYLMERVTDDQFALVDGKVVHLPGGVDEYLRRADARAAQDQTTFADMVGTGMPDGAAGSPANVAGAAAAAAGISNAELRQMKKTMSSNMRKIGTLESKIAKAQDEMHTVDPSDYVALGEAQAKIDALQAEKDELELEWMELAELVGE